MPRTVINLRNVDSLGIDQPRWAELTSMEEIDAFIEKVGFPILIRPSYVLSERR